MKMKSVVFFLVVALIANVGFGGGAVESVGDVRLKGYLGDRLDLMINNHVVKRDVDYITSLFSSKSETRYWWQTEFWGKWMHSAVPYLKYMSYGDLRSPSAELLQTKIEYGIDLILSSQEECGYIGNYPENLRCGEGWDVWGCKYTMMGLLHYYDYMVERNCPDKAAKALAACENLCNYIITQIGPRGQRKRELWQTGNWSGYASSSILEPVMWLYNRTKKDGYFEFATYIVKGMEEPETGPRLVDLALKGVSVADRDNYGRKYNKKGKWSYVCKYGRSKAYEMMSCYQGLLEYSAVAQTKGIDASKYINSAVMSAEDIVREEVNLAGGCASSEAWFHGAKKQHLPYARLQETCVTTTWMRFCEKLLEVTGDPKWADEIEKTFYNAYLGAMRQDGGEFEAYTPLSGTRWHGMHHCRMHTDCCTANGPRGFLCFLKKMFYVEGDNAVFNFYSSALVKGKTKDGRDVAFDMYSLYPRENRVRIVSRSSGDFNLKLRVPAWSVRTAVTVNGKVLPCDGAGKYFVIDRCWKMGDVVEITFSMDVVAHCLEHHIAFTRGPILLARDSRFNAGDLYSPLRLPSVKQGSKVEGFIPVRVPSDGVWMMFSAILSTGTHSENPEGALPETVFFCDFASAGNSWKRDDYYRTWFPLELNHTD